MLDTGRAGDSDMASAQQPVLVAGRAPTGLCRGQDRPRGSRSSCPEGSVPAWSLSQFDCFPYRLAPPHRDLSDFQGFAQEWVKLPH